MNKYRSEVLEDIIVKLSNIFKEKFSAESEKLIIFSRKLFSVVSDDELVKKDIVDLYGVIMSLWKLNNNRNSKPAVKVFNPCIANNGWDSKHTVVQIASNDMPFIIDSCLMTLNKLGLGVHSLMHIGGIENDSVHDAVLTIEIDRQQNQVELFDNISKVILNLLSELKTVVDSFDHMKNSMQDSIKSSAYSQKRDVNETVAFLKWINDDNFIFLAISEYEFKDNFIQNKAKSYGLYDILHDDQYQKQINCIENRYGFEVFKSEKFSPIHRNSHVDVICTNIYNESGKFVGLKYFIGLYTSKAYHAKPSSIPCLRKKVSSILKLSGFRENGHSYKSLLNVIEEYPKDELSQTEFDELFLNISGIMHISERQVTKLFIRFNKHANYYFCMLYMPRENFNSEIRKNAENILLKGLGGINSSFKTHFLESILCRVDFLIYIDPKNIKSPKSIKILEKQIIEASKKWNDGLLLSLIHIHGEHKGRLFFHRYKDSFSKSYIYNYDSRIAATDLINCEEALKNSDSTAIYSLVDDADDTLRLKFFVANGKIDLSLVIPVLENMGLYIEEEKPYKIHLENDAFIHLSDFKMKVKTSFDFNAVKDNFKIAFSKIWKKQTDNDKFNALIINAMFSWRDVAIIRTYARYMKQTTMQFSEKYLQDTFLKNANIVGLLVELFHIKFNPKNKDFNYDNILKNIEICLNEVVVLDEDKILRTILSMILATVRTNFYQKDKNGGHKSYISIKMLPRKINNMPKPVPLFEIFMNSPEVEGVHLRGAKVARGGLRWSDRKEDYRTEVLGLVKAQQVKNAVIVPLGSKGGFVPKKLPFDKGRDAVLEEGINCYKLFINSLLDLTDNIKDGKTISPIDVVCYDEPDPYLVVAADKGTATFSDISNEIAIDRDFWLGDAFASGGSVGYDHKKMGITAKGAWESVKIHFLNLDVNIQKESFSVIGIGDMAGDVFGNGMLLSKHIKLLGAFNHMHIFLDPNPNITESFNERERLFNLPSSSWTDYNSKLISKGGGIFNRNDKSIKISDEIKNMLGAEKNNLEPNEVIKLMLKANIDLLWNGGIGTYVKSKSESNIDVGDRANDLLRINGSQLGCKVVGEGGNLGFTQLGRIEFAKKGGLINTDAIDNSAGVDCSDHEVNIKILLQLAIDKELLKESDRTALLSEMTNDVETLVLRNNYYQNITLKNALKMSTPAIIDSYGRMMREQEKKVSLDREVEYLPTDGDLATLIAKGENITAPELSVIMAYNKTLLKEKLLKSNLPEDPYFKRFLLAEFPTVLQEKFSDLMMEHHLSREIIATQVANYVSVQMGITFIQRLYDAGGAVASDIIKSLMVVLEIFNIRELWVEIDDLSNNISQVNIMTLKNITFNFIRKVIRWILKNNRENINISELNSKYSKIANDFIILFNEKLSINKLVVDEEIELIFSEIPQDNKVIDKMKVIIKSSPMMGMIEILSEEKSKFQSENDLIDMFEYLNVTLSLSGFRSIMSEMKETTYWGSLSISAMSDDLDDIQNKLSYLILKSTDENLSIQKRYKQWNSEHLGLVSRYKSIVSDIQANRTVDFVSLNMVIRSLTDLI